MPSADNGDGKDGDQDKPKEPKPPKEKEKEKKCFDQKTKILQARAAIKALESDIEEAERRIDELAAKMDDFLSDEVVALGKGGADVVIGAIKRDPKSFATGALSLSMSTEAHARFLELKMEYQNALDFREILFDQRNTEQQKAADAYRKMEHLGCGGHR